MRNLNISSETALLTRHASTMEISSVAPSAPNAFHTGDPATTSSSAQAKANALAGTHAATALHRLAPGECSVSVLWSAHNCLLLERYARPPSGGGDADVKIFAGAHAMDGAPSDGDRAQRVRVRASRRPLSFNRSLLTYTYEYLDRC